MTLTCATSSTAAFLVSGFLNCSSLMLVHLHGYIEAAAVAGLRQLQVVHHQQKHGTRGPTSPTCIIMVIWSCFIHNHLGLDHFRAKCWAYTSPQGMSSRALKEVHLYVHSLIMPLLTLNELLAVRKSVTAYQWMTEEQLGNFFMVAGGSGRLVLEQPTFKGLTFEELEQLLTAQVLELNDTDAQVTWESTVARGHKGGGS